MIASAKLAKEVPTHTLVFFRNIISLIILTPFIFKEHISLKTKRLYLHFIRGTVGVLAIFCFFLVPKYMNLTDSILLFNTLPLFIPLVTLVWRKYRISLKRLLALVIGFIGIVFILKPQFSFHPVVSIIGFLGGLFAAIAHVSVRQLTKTDDERVILFYFFFISSIISAFSLLLKNSFVFSYALWKYVLLTGFFSFIFQYFLTKAYKHAKATQISSLLYFSVLWGLIIDLVVFKTFPDILTILGSVLIIGGGIYTIFEKDTGKFLSKTKKK